MVALAFVAAGARAGDSDPTGLGHRLTALGDLDGDGLPEFAAATRVAGPGISVVSAKSGRVLWTQMGADACAVPDQDGDGRPDVAVASILAREWIVLCNGATGKTLRTLTPPGLPSLSEPGTESWAISSAGDVDADGKPDLLVVRHGKSGSPGIMWYAKAGLHVVGLDGKLIATVESRIDDELHTFFAGPAGDFDRDGRADLLVRQTVDTGKLQVRVVSVTKGVLRDFSGRRPCDSIVPFTDADGDGVADFLVGVILTGGPGQGFAGEARVMSGKTGGIVRAAKGSRDGDYLGASVAALGDIDGDGAADFAAGAPGADAGKDELMVGAVRAFSGRTLKQLWIVKGASSLGVLGTTLCAIGDVDGDGVTDLAAGAPGRMFGTGYVLVLSGKTGKQLSSVRAD